MRTPVCDFVSDRIGAEPFRFHMPGHKGKTLLGPEPLDITEVFGAGELYASSGPIGDAETLTAELFGAARTCWSTEGSSQCIRAMLALALQHSARKSRVILAARNAHRAFLSGCALLDLEPCWLYPEDADFSLCSCPITPEQTERALRSFVVPPAAVYLTSPDYLGSMQDIAGISAVCRRFEVPLLVDNAHGAYLHFLEPSLHPLDLGADLCCDSAHKTLPALTGCAYLHISRSAPEGFAREAKRMLALFGSTSPSWLLLQSLDAVNAVLADGYPRELRNCVSRITGMKRRLSESGWLFAGTEPMKLTLAAGAAGYTGPQLAAILRDFGIESEYADPDYLVLMPSPGNTPEELERLESVLRRVVHGTPLPQPRFRMPLPERVLSPREAMLCQCETVPAAESVGRILAESSMSCPPAVSVFTAGERISAEGIPILHHYGITELPVVV